MNSSSEKVALANRDGKTDVALETGSSPIRLFSLLLTIFLSLGSSIQCNLKAVESYLNLRQNLTAVVALLY